MASRQTDTLALRKIMLDRGFLTVSSLSETTNINRNTLGKVLAGKIQPSADVMDKLIEVLGIDPKDAGEIFFKSNLPVA